MSFLDLILLFILIALSAFMSAAEVALFSLSRFQLKSMRDRFKSSYRRIRRLLDDPGGVLLSILLLNELVNIAASSLIAQSIFNHWHSGSWTWLQRLRLYYFVWMPEWTLQALVGVLVSTPLLLFLCELTPKSIAARANQMIAPLTAGPLTWVYDLLKPFRTILALIFRSSQQGYSSIDSHDHIKEEEVLTLVEEGRKEGDIRLNEVGLIRNVLELDDMAVQEIMTPIQKVFSLEHKTTIHDAIRKIQNRSYSRIPVWAEKKHHIIGVLYTRDLLIAKLDPNRAHDSIQTLMRKPLRFGNNIRLDSLFKKIKQQRVHLAIIESSPGHASGIVTLSDILDEIFDDLIDPDALTPLRNPQ